MKKVPLALALFFSVLSANLPADTVILTSGEKLEGKILSETPADVTIRVKVSASITDERTLKREEIQKIEKSSADDIAFTEIASLKPNPLVAQPAVIDQGIATLKAFLAKYPQSPHAADAKGLLDTFQQEKEHLAAGEVKYYGTWISKAAAADRAVSLKCESLLAAMKEQASHGDLVNALNNFDQLEKVGPATRAFPAGLEIARQILPVMLQQANRASDNLAHEMEEWKKGVAITAEPAKSQMIAAEQLEQDRYAALMDGAQKGQIKWPPFIARSQRSLDAIRALITSESPRLSALPLNMMNASLAATEKAARAFLAKDFSAAEELAKQAAVAWPQNEEAILLQKDLTTVRAEAAKRAEEAAKATPTPKPSATPKPAATPVPTPAAEVAAPVEKPTWIEFFSTIQGAMCIVGGAVALLVIVAVAQKLKKPKDDGSIQS